MFYKKTVLTLAVLGLVLGGGIIVTDAYQGNPTITGPNYTPERHAIITQALSKQDYVAWQEAMIGRPIANKVNQDNFNKFARAWQLAQDGKLDEARALRQEIGLGNGVMNHGVNKGQGQWRNNSQGHHGNNINNHFLDDDNDGVCDYLN